VPRCRNILDLKTLSGPAPQSPGAGGACPILPASADPACGTTRRGTTAIDVAVTVIFAGFMRLSAQRQPVRPTSNAS
jgi:hypothetical protein